MTDDQNGEKPTVAATPDQGILANDHDNDKLGQDGIIKPQGAGKLAIVRR